MFNQILFFSLQILNQKC